MLERHLFVEVEINCACEINYILAPIDSKTINKIKKNQQDVMWEKKCKSLFCEMY